MHSLAATPIESSDFDRTSTALQQRAEARNVFHLLSRFVSRENETPVDFLCRKKKIAIKLKLNTIVESFPRHTFVSAFAMQRRIRLN